MKAERVNSGLLRGGAFKWESADFKTEERRPGARTRSYSSAYYEI